VRSFNKICFSAGVGAIALATVAGVCFGFDDAAEIHDDLQLRAMVDELARAKALQLNNLERTYFVSYSVGDSDELVVAGALGGLNTSRRIQTRNPRVEVRVGSYQFDNTNSVFSGFPKLGLLPVDDDYDALRTSFWLATDGMYKLATGQITRKRSALRELLDSDQLPDLAPASKAELLLAPSKLTVDQAHWEDQLRRLSGIFAQYPSVLSSGVRLLAVGTTYRFVNSEGTVVRMPENLADLEIQSNGLAPDGSSIWNHQFITMLQPSELPKEEQISAAVRAVAAQTDALEKAPAAEEYSGPVLFEQEAAAEMIAEVMADASRLQRKPLAPPGSNQRPVLESVWASRAGTKVAPDWLTMVDDPLQMNFGGKILAGQYQADDEGVPASKVTLVEKGVLKGFLLSREPVKTYRASNGHGRLPGAYGSEEAVIGNLFVQAEQTAPESQMKAKLITEAKAAGLTYGILIRRLDFPSTSSLEELQGIAREMQKNGYTRTLTAPLLAYRVYPDGHEELIRNVRFKEFSARNLKDILLASDRPYVLNYLNNGSAFNFADASSEVTSSSVICPSLLLASVELDRAHDEARRPPVVPPPALVAQKR
jgi:TldD protein